MKIINHRVNTASGLQSISDQNGVEIDVRDFGKDLVLSHDAFCGGELFEDFLRNYHKSTLIINVKSEGIEKEVFRLLKKFQIEDFFLLDCSFSAISKMILDGEKRFAARFSEIESINSVFALTGKADWVWIDYFSLNPFNPDVFIELKKRNYRICICSPDLLGWNDLVEPYVAFFLNNKIRPDAVCVKMAYQKYWEIL